ncbi:UNC5C-like protein [Patiria miniata]|uniref:Netrin receptor UNC5 n=1 Tax=Patiria miniata TaxID=46514 RepID=A0A914BB62_PATMI|nr:UNC5C-like protein [Patiria miniata]
MDTKDQRSRSAQGNAPNSKIHGDGSPTPEENNYIRKNQDQTEPFDEVENTERRHPHAVRLFRGFFRWLCFCNHTPKADTSKELYLTNSILWSFHDSFHSVPHGTDLAQTSSPQPSTDPVFSDEESSPDQSAAMDELKNVTLDKQDLLDLFDSMCQEAKGMGHDVVGRVVQVLNFAAAVLDSRGGILSVDALGVHLYIPPGAIPAEESPQIVYMYVQGRNHLTPYVQCGPSKFEFRKDVILILPHCAKDAVDTKFNCVKSSSSGNQTIEGGKDGNVIVKSKSILMTMRHFCGLTAYGNPKAKYMVARVFIKDINDTNVMVRVRLFDDTKANLQEIQTAETRNGFVQVDMPGTLEVKRTDPEKDVRINLMCSDTDCWVITEPQSGWQTIQHSILWRECGPDNVPSFPSKIFKASMRRSTERAPFDGYLKVFQEGREEQSVDFALTYSLNVAKATSPRQITEEQVKEICRQQIREQLRGPVAESRLLDEETIRKLCSRLDEPSPIGRDWRILPENLTGLKGHGHGWVESIKTRAASGFLTPQSPTELVLDAFFATSRESDMGNRRTLQELKRGLHSLNRPDVRFAIKVIDDQICPDPQETNINVKTTYTLKFEKDGEVPEIKSEQDQPQMYRSQSLEQPPQRNFTAMNGTREDLGRDRASSTSDLLSSSISASDPEGQINKLDSKQRTDSAYESYNGLDTDDR